MQSRSEQERTGQRKPEEQQGKAKPCKAISTTRRVDHQQADRETFLQILQMGREEGRTTAYGGWHVDP
jgi:hypothetical protein